MSLNFTIDVQPPPWLTTVMHVNAAISMVINSFAGYCILKKSSADMKTYRWFLFNIWFWSFTTDLNVTMVLMPYCFFPLIAAASANRYLKMLPIHLQFGYITYALFSVCMCTGSLASGFLYRWCLIIPRCWVLKNNRRLLWVIFAVHLQVSLFCVVPFLLLAVPDSGDMVQFIGKNIFNAQELFNSGYAYIFYHPSFTPYFQYCTLAWFLTDCEYFSLCIFAVWDSVRRLNSYSNIMSTKTKAMHSYMLKALVIQTIVPLTFYILPLVGMIAIVTFNIQMYNIKERSNYLVTAFGTHSIWNSLLMLGLYKPYRSFVIDCFRRSFGIIIPYRFTKRAPNMQSKQKPDKPTLSTAYTGSNVTIRIVSPKTVYTVTLP